MMTALQVEPVSLGIFGVAPDKPLFFSPCQLQAQFPRYLAGNFILDHEDVARLAIELRAP